MLDLFSRSCILCLLFGLYEAKIDRFARSSVSYRRQSKACILSVAEMIESLFPFSEAIFEKVSLVFLQTYGLLKDFTEC